MMMAAPRECAHERVLARVAELKQVLQHVQSADVRDTVVAAIADMERRNNVPSDPAASRPPTRADDQHRGRLAVG